MKNQLSLFFVISSILFVVTPLTVAADFELGGGIKYSVPRTHASSTAWREALDRALERAIDPGDYVCSAPTKLDTWLDDQFSQIDPLTLAVMDGLGLYYWAFDAKLLFDHDAKGEYIGANGEYTRRQVKTFKDNRRFWDIYSDDILLMGAHGAEISDDGLMHAYLPVAFGPIPPFAIDIILDAARSTIEGGVVDLTGIGIPVYFESPGIPRGYANPLLSLNAFAFSSFGTEVFPGFGIIPDKLVMGEGLLDALTGIGLGDKEAPDYVLSHEFAHHVQFEIGAIEPGPNTPEKTRRSELMADGFAAYYGSHARGDSFQAKRFADVMASAFEVGDCAFGNPNHHGTHLQRLKAALWGEWVSDSAPDQGHIYSPATMLELFEEALPILVAPDAP